MQIVVNKCFGCFGLSDAALQSLPEGIDWSEHANRVNPLLIQVVSDLGPGANTRFSELSIFDIPEEATDWAIEDYDGFETILYVLDGKIYKT